ncbi:MAG: hypothetical protein RLZZ76_582 [Candidatus Parcubacteria bacterium]
MEPSLPFSTPNDLLDALKALRGASNDSTTPKTYRYVIYARKSTDQNEKQVRSLDDQILECKLYAERQGLTVLDIIVEAESAKEPDVRPKFRELIKNIQERGKYDAILSWHPDRLARNMKDAGEVIDLLDKHIIKDLKFVSFTFENSTSGKMLLGIMFALSKEYSDKLSDDISRGNKRSIEDGAYINRAKHGYFKDVNQHLCPDGNNFLLIKQAFQMRVESKTLDQIARFLNENHYMRWHKGGSHQLLKWSIQSVQKMLCDPIYAGVVMYGKGLKTSFANLADHYDFQPAILVADFMRINKLSNNAQLVKLARKYKKGEDVKANLMRGMIICGSCGETMTCGITSKKKPTGVSRYFYYRCETDKEECSQKPKNIRAKVVLNYVKDFLAKKPFSSKEAYEHYAQEMKRVSAERVRTAQNALLTLKLEKGKMEDRLIQTKEFLVGEKDSKVQSSFRSDVIRYEENLKKLKADIGKAEIATQAQKDAILTYEEFLELMDNMPKLLGSMTNMTDLDFVIRKIFSNFTIQGKNTAKSTLCAPFDALYDLNIANSGDGGN